MENYMNRLFKSKNLLEDNKLNAKIEKIFDNKLFQKIVEKTDVLEGEDLSITKSHANNKILDSVLFKSISKNFLKNDSEKKSEKKNNLEKKNFLKKKSPEKNNNNEEMKIKGFLNNSDLTKSLLTITDYNQYNNLEDNNLLKELTCKISDDYHDVPSEINNTSRNFEESFDINSFSCWKEKEMEIDEYENDEDNGYEVYDIPLKELEEYSKNLIEELDLKNKMIFKTDLAKNNYLKSFKDRIKVNKEHEEYYYLPTKLKHPKNNSKEFPKKVGNTIYDYFQLKMIFDRERTGFEESKEFPIIINSIIAGRYKIIEFLGAAAFSKAVHVVEKTTGNHYCLKIIENNKDYFDQSIDEIKILRYINTNGNVDEKCILKIYDSFYYKEHLFIVTELLKDNLYDYYKFNLENEEEKYFTIPTLRSLSLQMLEALEYLHSLHLIHCDVKPENIMIKSYSNSLFKLIDFGSSCYIHDHLSSYIQSRYYRAPEVILGCKYDYKVDLWSLGCVLVELYTGRVLMNGNDMADVLVKICSVLGPFPDWMLNKGKHVGKYFTKDFLIYKEYKKEGDEVLLEDEENVAILIPKKTNLKHRLKTEDTFFLDFLYKLLSIDPNKRMTAKQALQHPWFQVAKY